MFTENKDKATMTLSFNPDLFSGSLTSNKNMPLLKF